MGNSIINEVGNKYGGLTVMAPVESEGRGARWLCYCNFCGEEKIIKGIYLRNQQLKSCGCRSLIKDETENKYGKLIVVALVKSKKKSAHWLCQCTCGEKKIIRGCHLRSGMIKSCGCLRTLPPGEAAFNNHFREYQYVAKKYNRIWDISRELFKELTSKSCFYCGSPPKRRPYFTKKYNGGYLYNGLDRVDNNKNYTPDNVVPCCTICNRAKHALSQGDFFTWVQRISEYRGNKN